MRDTLIGLPLTCPQLGNLVCTPGMHPNWELNQLWFGSQASTQSTEPHQPGQKIKLKIKKKNFRHHCLLILKTHIVLKTLSYYCFIWTSHNIFPLHLIQDALTNCVLYFLLMAIYTMSHQIRRCQYFLALYRVPLALKTFSHRLLHLIPTVIFWKEQGLLFQIDFYRN